MTESQDDVLAVGAVYTGCTDGRCQFVCWLQSTISYQFILMMIFWLVRVITHDFTKSCINGVSYI